MEDGFKLDFDVTREADAECGVMDVRCDEMVEAELCQARVELRLSGSLADGNA